MGDDPFVPGLTSEAVSHGSGSSATGGQAIHIHHDHGLSKGQSLFVVVASCLAIGLALGAVVMMAWGQSIQREHNRQMLEAAERRFMDRAFIGERETKLNSEQMRMLLVELEKQGIKLPPIH
jgi:hypothetical protein